jgi:CXXX repeat peptide maturase
MGSLIAILDRGAAPFCHYVNPHYHAARPQWMPPAVLEKTVRFAQDRRLRLLCLMGHHPLPKRHASILKETRCVYMAPMALHGRMKDAVPIIEAGDVGAVARLRGDPIDNAVLRLGRKDMPRLGSIFARLAGKFRRLNICLLDLGQYQEDDFAVYRRQLEAMADTVAGMNWPGGPLPRRGGYGRTGGQARRSGTSREGGTECNLVTDRVMLQAMNNCDAGIKHITVAPDGRLYLCPGFYHWQEGASVGSLDEGLRIDNGHLLTAEYAPICRQCDAYHCRRCLLLNKQLTDEINTPSRQQCVAAHCEREQSRRLLDFLGRENRLNQAVPATTIPALDYLDPFELIKRASERAHRPRGSGYGSAGGNGPGGASQTASYEGVAADGQSREAPWNELRALLMELRAGQEEILDILRPKNGSKPILARSRRGGRPNHNGDKKRDCSIVGADSLRFSERLADIFY